MELGTFSISLNVKDLQASIAFYEALGFSKFIGHEEQGWVVMKNGDANIGLFQGMLERNIITFNPGWDQDGKELKAFTDIHVIQDRLKTSGLTLEQEANQGDGRASFSLVDPDGNMILVDQHVAAPK